MSVEILSPAAAPPQAPTPTAPQRGPQAAPLLVDAVEAARLCGVSRAHWLSLGSSGRIPAPLNLGRRTLWRVIDIERWVAAGCPSRDRFEALAAGRGKP